MTPEQIDRVFGCGRLKMATGEHVEVFREAVAPGERRRYTKRFLATSDGDFGPWTEREWRILARLIGHGVRCVPDVVQFDGGAMGGLRLVQTYDAGVTVDQWATLLPVTLGGTVRRHIFEDCAHWWALAHHCLAALNEIHALELVHLDIKADNICIPYGPADFDPDSSGLRLYPVFARLALIDFAFSLVSRENLATPLPIGWQKDYDYQSPRLLKALEAGRNGDLEPTKELDWRCDFYSLAAMLRRYLPADGRAPAEGDETGWAQRHYDDARSLIFRLRDCHDRDLPHWRPHPQLMDFTGARLDERELATSLDRGWTLARDTIMAGTATPITPITRVARSWRVAPTTPMTRIVVPERVATVTPMPGITSPQPAADRGRIVTRVAAPAAVITVPGAMRARIASSGIRAAKALALTVIALIALAAPPFIGDPQNPLVDHARVALETLRSEWRAQWNSPVAGNNAPAPVPAQPSEPDRAAASADEAPAVAQEPADHAASAPSQDTRTATATPVQEQVAGASTTAANQVAAAPTPAQHQAAAPSIPVEAQALAAAPVATSNAPGVALSPAVPRLNEATSSSAKTRTKSGVQVNRSLAAKRSSPSASVSALPRRAPSTALASAPGRTSSRPVPLEGTRVQSVPPPLRMAAATITPSRPQPGTQTPSAASVSSGAPDNQHEAQSSALPNPSPETQSATAANADQRASAPATPARSGGGETPSRDQGIVIPMPKQPRSATQPRDEWHAFIDTVFGVLRNRDGPPAPIDERSVQSSAAARPAAVPPAPARSAPDLLAQAAPSTPSPSRVQGSAAARPASAALTAAPSPIAAPAPLIVESWVEADPAPRAALATLSVEPRTQAGPASGAQAATPLAGARAQMTTPWMPAPVAGTPLPPAEPPRVRPVNNANDAWMTQARRVLTDTVPRVAAQAEPDVSRVLWAAALANQPYQTQVVVEAASARWASENVAIPANNVAPTYARLMHNDARQALASGRDVSDVVNLELQAFGANPRDADIAGYLAFLHLRMKPAQPETARQLALHAIAISGSRRSTRSDDWGTLAVASALTGREADAVRAYLAEIALTGNIDRTCWSALSAYASFGERLRVPVQAMLYRVHSLGRGYANPSCAWPSYWNAAARSAGAY